MEEIKVSREDLSRLLGSIDDHKAVEIIALRPSLEELEEVAAYLANEDDVMGEERHPLAGTVARIYEIVTHDEPQEGDDYRGNGV